MKILIYFTITVFYISTARAQMPTLVNDPQANSSLASRLSQGALQVQNGVKQLMFLKDAKEVVVKVNNALRDVNEIQEIYNIQVKILNNATNSTRNLRQTKLFSPTELSHINNSYGTLLDSSMKSLKTLDKLLSDNLFKMGDAERLALIKGLKEDLQEKQVGTEILYDNYMAEAQKRAMKKMFTSNQ